MGENYNPNGREIVTEMLKDVGQYFNRNNLEKIGGKLKETGQHFLWTAGTVTVSPYILPTVVKSFRDSNTSSDETQLDVTYHVGCGTGLITGLAIDIGQIIGYGHAVNNDHPEVLAIPVVTNIASALYEKAKSTKEKLIARHNSQTLDSVVEGTQK